ncbi:hypothetical protein FEDK69T_18770 [Flavobacterium enshiense DK69]|uniref:Uncharacterized protein n=1 Tax=Flavobacterium enshiense DK69 TaxID=1107311 RepID=V6S7I8_9FLAO|nr:hypothetical protein [Flavobacterium enshiense]ESU22621.1 hypothetical protein FEDK69T_18770 [Flavobacterium enshiense DK69]KGO95665.1 hypothetical protein Q767_10635 [Flavobacterium enshiense DK69]
MDKNNILQHIEDFTADQLFGFIKQGITTLDELKQTGNLDSSKRKAIVALQTSIDEDDDAAWEIARYGNESKLSDYITNFPAGKHVLEAKQKIDTLVQQRANAQAEKQKILNNIQGNPNFYAPSKILEYLQSGTFTESDLINSGIPQSAIDSLGNIQTPELTIGLTPSSIPPDYTEVYFWGGTGSGKTCALGAILQVAEQKGYLNIATGPGYLYANQLKNIFSDDGVANDFLPAPSPLDTTQYLPFTVKKPNEKNSRSVSLIELSGEIFKCFFLKNSGHGLPTRDHENTFNSLNSFLSSTNRKIHFFFIDYDRENKPDGSGLKQSDYLAAASTYFKNNQVFGKTTDAIFVVLTKSDLLTDEQGNNIPVAKRVEYAKKHLNEKNYSAFINTLKDNCKKYSINGGKLTVEPFSLGKVYFQQICDFDGSSAGTIVEILMERIAPSKKSLLDIFNK